MVRPTRAEPRTAAARRRHGATRRNGSDERATRPYRVGDPCRAPARQRPAAAGARVRRWARRERARRALSASGASLPHLGAWLVGLLLRARTRGLPPRALSEFVERGMTTRRMRAACIECNHDRPDLLCDELATDHGYVSDSVPLDQLSTIDPPVALRRADLSSRRRFTPTGCAASRPRCEDPTEMGRTSGVVTSVGTWSASSVKRRRF